MRVTRLHHSWEGRSRVGVAPDGEQPPSEQLMKLSVDSPEKLLELIGDLAFAGNLSWGAARTRDSWEERCGAVLWWRFPIIEPPYVGSPLDDDFPDYVTHWTPISVPKSPSEKETST